MKGKIAFELWCKAFYAVKNEYSFNIKNRSQHVFSVRRSLFSSRFLRRPPLPDRNPPPGLVRRRTSPRWPRIGKGGRAWTGRPGPRPCCPRPPPPGGAWRRRPASPSLSTASWRRRPRPDDDDPPPPQSPTTPPQRSRRGGRGPGTKAVPPSGRSARRTNQAAAFGTESAD